jgi:hypothetical protein
VSNGERRHCDGDAPPLSNKDHQRQHKQKMIEAEQDVLNAKPQISAEYKLQFCRAGPLIAELGHDLHSPTTLPRYLFPLEDNR